MIAFLRWLVVGCLLSGGALAENTSLSPAFNGGQITNPLLIGTGTVTGNPYQFQSAINIDPSGLSVSGQYNTFQQTLNYSTTTSRIWEGVPLDIYVNGPGAANGEINGYHAYMQFNCQTPGTNICTTGAAITAAENFEASMQNYGTISGSHIGFYYVVTNEATGVASSLNGIKFQLTNLNAAAASVGTYSAVDCEAPSGGGTAPSFDYCIRNVDTKGIIGSLGPIVLGSLSAPGAGTLLQIKGTDNSGGTFPVVMTNLAGTQGFLMDNSGRTYFGNLATQINSSGDYTGPDIALGSPTGGNKGSGTINVAGGYYVNNVAIGVPYQVYSCAVPLTTGVGASTLTCFMKAARAFTVDNIIATVSGTLVTVTPSVFECGTSTTCASPTTIGSGAVTSSNTATPITVSSASVAAGDYIAVELTAGTVTSVAVNIQVEMH